MQIIREALSSPDASANRVVLRADRATLSKRRWRGVADDGVEFGFDLEHPLVDGAIFHEVDGRQYIIGQNPEPLLELVLPEAAAAARLGWMLGNLHFPIAVDQTAVYVPDDPAVRQVLEREKLPIIPVSRVFRPLSGGHHH